MIKFSNIYVHVFLVYPINLAQLSPLLINLVWFWTLPYKHLNPTQTNLNPTQTNLYILYIDKFGQQIHLKPNHHQHQ
jgi:hypothetical protein